MNNSIVNIKPYVVNSGDNLTKIASQNNTTVQDILNINAGIVDPNVLAVGQVINLPENVNLTPNVEMVQVTPLNAIPNLGEMPNQNIAVTPEAIAMQQALMEQAAQAQALQELQAAEAAKQAQANAILELQKQIEAQAKEQVAQAQALQAQMQAEKQAQAIEAMNNQNVIAQAAPAVATPVSLPQDSDTLNMLYGLVAAEAGTSNGAEEARAVADVLINRVRSGVWGGNDLRSVMTAKGQFAVISNGRYKTSNPTIEQINAINEEFTKAGMGLPTTYNYSKFRANRSGYSGLKVTPNGNEYRV